MRKGLGLVLVLGLWVGSGCREEPKVPPPAASGPWSQLKQDMSQEQVQQLLGQPTSKYSDPIEGTTWTYGQGPKAKQVFFDTGGKLRGWNVPK